MKHLFVFALLFSITSCSFFKKKTSIDADVIARVNDDYLYASDLGNLTKGLTGQDSLDVLKSYSETWVRKKLLMQKAVENISEDDLSIARKMEDYRETLILYEYEKALINQKLDTAFRPQEMSFWYEKLKGDFLLENDVYRIYFIKVKKDAQDLAKARKWILNPKEEEDLQKLAGYAKEFAMSYSIDNGVWYEKDNALKSFPLSEYDLSQLGSSKQYREFKEEGVSWFVKIAEVLKKGEPSPPEFLTDKIERAIIEKRKVELVEKVYNKIYQDGQASKSFEIYLK